MAEVILVKDFHRNGDEDEAVTMVRVGHLSSYCEMYHYSGTMIRRTIVQIMFSHVNKKQSKIDSIQR